jgi:hypothetical protein
VEARFFIKLWIDFAAEPTIRDGRFYQVFTQVLNSPFICGVPQLNRPMGFLYCAPAQ